MATREIKTRFKLEGEQAFKKAMTEAASSIKVLNSEQRLAAAEFEATGDAQQYASEKARILKEQIEQQKKAVKAAEDAVSALTKNGVEPNSKQMQSWKTKLNDAKASLAKMESQLDKTEGEIKDQTSELGKAKTAMSNAETKVKSLTSEEALAAAQFEATGDKEQYLANKARILKEKIEAQKKVVAEAEAAIKSMTDNGVDPNAKEMVEWKTKLNDAKASLAKMESQLDKTEGEIKDQTSEVTKAKTAYSSAEKKVKSLTEEEKLAAAQFKVTGDKEQYLADKTRILKDKIDAQKKAVTAAETAIKSLTDNGVDPNAKEVQEWRDKLVAAKTGLLNLQNRLDHVGDEVNEETKAFGEAETGAGDLKNAIDKVGEKVDYQNVISAIDSITGHMEKVVKAAAKAAKAIWEMGVDAGHWADDIATAANEMGVDPETYQSWMYASRFIDTSVADIQKSWQDIQKHMKDGNTDYLAMLAKMGIASMTASGQVRESKDIFWDAIDYLHGIGDAALMAEEATKLFGNDWRKLNPLITAGSKAYKDMADEGRSVAVVSNENVAALGEVDDAVQDFNARFDKLKYDTLAELAPTFKLVAEAMSEAVTALNEFVQSEEGQAALKELNEALSGVISSFLGEDNGKGTFASIVNTAKTAVQNFTNAMDWISKNGEAIKGIIEGMAIAWAGLKATKEILLFMMLLKATPLNKLQTLFNGGGKGGAPTGTGTPITPSAGTPKASGPASWWNNLKGKAAAALPAVKDILGGLGVQGTVLAAAIAPAVIADNQTRKEVTENLEAIREEATEAAEEIGEAGDAALQVVNESADALGVSAEKINIFGQGVLGDTEAIEKALDTAAALNDAAKDNPFLSGKTALKLQRQQAVGASGGAEDELLYQVMQEAADSLTNPKTQQAASDIGETISDAMDEIMEVQEALDESTTPESIESMYGLIDKLVENKDVLDSLSQGTKDLLGAYYDEESGYGAGSATQYSDAQEVLDAIFNDLDAAWDKYVAGGKNMPEGYAQGIQEGAGEASSAASDMAQGAVDAAEATLDSHSPSRVFETIGGNVAVGLANGIYARGNEAINAAQWLAQSVTNIVQSALQIHSPSKVFERLGSFTGLGFAEGIEGSADAVNRAVGVMLGATTRQPALTVGGVAVEGGGSAAAARRGAAGAAAGADTVHVTLVLDEEVLGDVMAPIVNDKIGAKINATRR